MSRAAVGVAAGVFAVHALQGLSLDAPWVLPDELHAADGARVISVGGRVGAPTLASLLEAPLWLLDPVVAYHAVKIVHALALAAAVVVAYLLARLVAGEGRALIAAAIAGLAPATVFASTTLSVAVATLLLAGSVLAWIRGRTVVAGVLLVAAAAAWPILIIAALPLALLAYGRRVGWRPLLEWPTAALWVAVAAFLYAAVALGRAASDSFAFATSSWGLVPAAGLAGAASFAVGLGVVPVVLAAARAPAARRAELPSQALADALLVASLALLVAAGVRGLGRSGSAAVDEAAFLPLLPLLCALAVAEVRPTVSRRYVLGAVAVVISALFLVPERAAHNVYTPGSALAGELLLAPLTLVAALLLLALNLAVALRLLRRRELVWPLLFAAAAGILVLGEMAAWSNAREAAADISARTPERDRLTELSDNRRVSYNADGVLPHELAGRQFWNPFLEPLEPPLSARQLNTATGTFAPPLPAGLVLDPSGQIAGTIVGRTRSGVLVDAGDQPRVAETIEGLYGDRWSGGEVLYRRFGGERREGRLDITVSRAGWRGASKPAQVVVTSRPMGGEPFAERITQIDSGQERVVELPVPPPPFEVRIAIGPLFSPADYGFSDSRQLGAQLSFDYRPA